MLLPLSQLKHSSVAAFQQRSTPFQKIETTEWRYNPAVPLMSVIIVPHYTVPLANWSFICHCAWNRRCYCLHDAYLNLPHSTNSLLLNFSVQWDQCVFKRGGQDYLMFYLICPDVWEWVSVTPCN